MARRSSPDPDHFTLLIVPHTRQAAISLSMPHWVLYLCLLLVIASLGGLALLAREYSVARSQVEVLRQDRQVEVDRQQAMRETILAQDVQVRSLAAETVRLNDAVLSMESLVADIRRTVGLDRLPPAANASTGITVTRAATLTATVTSTVTPTVTATVSASATAAGPAAMTATAPATTTTRANNPGAKSTPVPSGSMQNDRAAELAYAMADRQSGVPVSPPAVTSPAPSASLTSQNPASAASAPWASLGSEDRAATTTLASRGASAAAIDYRSQVKSIQTEVDSRLTSLRQLQAAVNERVSHLDDDKRTDAATVEQALRVYDAAPKLAPVKGLLDITSPFGLRVDPVTLARNSFHTGIDIAAWWGVNVYSTAAGKVTYADWQGTLGWTIEIEHALGFKTLYGHNRDLVAHLGEQVTAGQLIAHAGDTGKTTGPHVHYEIWFQGQQIDPMKYLDVSGGDSSGR